MKIFRSLLIGIILSLVICGFALLPVNPDPENCVCDNSPCSVVTCDIDGMYCQYKYYSLLDYWGLISGDTGCPPIL